MIQQPDSLHHAQQLEVLNAAQQAEGLQEEMHSYESEEKQSSYTTQSQRDSLSNNIFTSKTLWTEEERNDSTSNDSTTTSKADSNFFDTPFYRDNFFPRDSLLYTEKQLLRYGVAGDPMPYSLRADSILTSVIIVSTLATLFCLKRAKKFYSFQLRNFFRVVRNDSVLVKEAASDMRNLVFMIFQVAMVLSLVFFFFSKSYIGSTYIVHSEYTMMAIFLGEVALYFFLEIIFQRIVNATFFAKDQCEQWLTSKLLVYSLGDVLLTPLLLLTAFLGLSTENMITATLSVIIFMKILAIYKAFIIFFKKISSCLQFFLYLCTLEIIPTLTMWGIMLLTANYLKVNY